ncbi:ATP-binding protein [Desulfogranum marinum]|uniref:ATP-binding protein n=1 Tax=Desulfogranum marinum TaxID=453220 RepID=UPI0019644C95|nr:ATP-binding protein [Desulfogranum marinum]MBM9514309.1 ATP-binding protein [Desulfogranum marinum]
MIISVASGKGGTGKTTVSTNMALAIDRDVNFLDCDVEEPNAHLFLNPEIEKSELVDTPVPKVNLELCNQCRKCMDICRFNAITVVGEKVLVFSELCHSCGGCMLVCPEGAITEIGRELGTIEYGKTDHITFTHGKMRIGEAMSPPLIKEVRKSVNPEDLTIIDAPPGTSCPVIAAINGVDFVLMVTEPTPFGLHDLKLAVEAVKLLGIPSGLVINRSDLGTRDVYDYAQEQNIPVLLEIPFDRKIAETYSRGKTIVEAMPEWTDKFQKLFYDIEQIVES